MIESEKMQKKKKIRAEQINCGAEEIEKTVYAVKNLKLQWVTFSKKQMCAESMTRIVTAIRECN